jgi:hypothetical protein
MNCRGWNPHIALYVQGDLEAKPAMALDQHLLVCEECTRFLEELRSTQCDLLRLRNETVDEATLSRVRGRVLEQVRIIERRRTWMDRMAMWLWGGFRWRYAVMGGMAAVAIAAGSWRLSHVQPVVAPQAALPEAPMAVVPVGPVQTVEAVAPAVPTLRKVSRPQKPVPQEVQAANTLPPPIVGPAAAVPAPATPAEMETAAGKETLVQILTEDPNVVIYWLIDRTGGF